MEKPTLKEYYSYILDKEPICVEKRILYRIVRDFTDRRGLRHEWDGIDENIQEEILQKWQDIIWDEIQGLD